MNYKLIYDSLIERARNRALTLYKESHHVIPRCMGGSDDKTNLVDLTAEEHYLAHQLLVKIYPNHTGLSFAATTMTQSNSYLNRSGNKLYGWLRRAHAKNISQSQTGKVYYNNGVKSIKITPGGEIPDGFIKGRHYSPTTGKRNPGKNYSGSFKDKNLQVELSNRRWDKDRELICKQFNVDTIEQARQLVIAYKKELHPRYWIKPMLERYPFMTSTRLRSLIVE